ncbi:MAG TPA: DUF2339 domain-containing protein [Gemmatimonadaceae bacterium]
MTPEDPLAARVAALEESLASLTAEVRALREVVSDAKGPAQAAPRPRRRIIGARGRRLDPRDIEGLLGRYGMLAIAVLAAVAAVGTFLSWAIARGYLVLGPAARVLLGLAFATGIAVWGIRLRRTERSFGSSMLGLALVVAQICAYAAGPSFHLVSTPLAFVLAAASSWALAIFAHAENDEPLWCVGFGGATMAPFVTADGHASVFVVAAYGAIVLLPACFAISHRDWPVAWRVFYLASAVLTIAAAAQAHTEHLPGYLAAFGLPLAIAAGGVIPFAPVTRKRGALRWLALLSIGASLVAHGPLTTTMPFAAAMIVAACLWLGIVDHNASVAQSSIVKRGRELPAFLDWIDAAGVPLLLGVQAVNLLDRPIDSVVAYAVLLAALLVFAWRRAVGPLRDAAAFAAVVSAVGAIDFVRPEMPTGRVAAFLVIGLASLALHKLRPSRSWLVMGGVVVIAAAATATNALAARPVYQITPFATEASLASLLVTAALVLISRFWYWVRVATRASIADRAEWTYAGMLRVVVRGVTVAPWVWAFIWVMLELAMAYSASTATLLLVTYFAATAVACVAAGRARHSARLRQTGLALALVAAATACVGATSYFDLGTRVVAYLVTSAFLLGIAYWYRRPGNEDTGSRAVT